MTSKHKSEDYKLSVVEYYLVGDKYENIIKGAYDRPKNIVKTFK